MMTAPGREDAAPLQGDRTDVLVMGGGLAGLSLALQLKRRMPSLDVQVLERRSHPVPSAAHKVGESTVEIGARYFSHVLGLAPYLRDHQLRKFGFRFFFSDGRRDLGGVAEIGASRHLDVPSWQLDRGLFENHLGEAAREHGVRFIDAATVQEVSLREDQPHEVRWQREGDAAVTTSARWVVDATGRAGRLRRQLGLDEENAHEAHAVWFRIADRLVLDDWCDDPAWQERCHPRARWLSTNHLVGPGYWVWLIPLASGSHSVGIVADPRLQPLEEMDTFERAMDWLARRQPRLHEALAPRRHLLQDFRYLRRFSYGCRQVFSAGRWALTGEAGLFLDPFYSPGSDFIAIANTYITDLVERDREGRALQTRARLYDETFHSFYETTLTLYQDQYALFGDPEVLPVKVVWDYAYYWGVLAPFFFHDRLTDLQALAGLRDTLAHTRVLNREVQSFLRRWSSASERLNAARMHDQAALPWFAALNRGLLDTLDDKAFRERIRTSCALLHALATEIRDRAALAYPALDSRPLDAALEEAGALTDGMPATGGGLLDGVYP
jgi:flavin-dependent dehydrogenase